jgi:hypothetical protein
MQNIQWFNSRELRLNTVYDRPSYKAKRKGKAIPITGLGGLEMFPVTYENHLHIKK